MNSQGVYANIRWKLDPGTMGEECCACTAGTRASGARPACPYPRTPAASRKAGSRLCLGARTPRPRRQLDSRTVGEEGGTCSCSPTGIATSREAGAGF